MYKYQPTRSPIKVIAAKLAALEKARLEASQPASPIRPRTAVSKPSPTQK